MGDKLKRSYFKILAPAILGFILVSIARTFDFIHIEHIPYEELFVPLVFVLSVISAIAFPIFFRVLFAHKMRQEKSTPKSDFIKFERKCMYIALITPYLTLIAYLLEFPPFFLAGTFLMALYATYYFYPSKKRIEFEKRIFRVK